METPHTDYEAAEDHEATHDHLTGLLNRRGLSERLDLLIKEVPGAFAVFVIDLDGLKAVNDTEGHKSGDNLLLRTAEGLQEAVRHHNLDQEPRKTDIVARGRQGQSARPGGDEFVVVFPGVTNEEDLAAVGRRLQDALSEIDISASVGGSLHRRGMDKDEVIARADQAMYGNKIDRKLAKYSPEQRQQILALGALAAEHEIDLRDVTLLLPIIAGRHPQD